MNEDENIVLASTYRLTAVSFWQSAKVIHNDFETRGETTIGNIRATPLYLLLSHACELFLKSALLKRGISETELRQPGLRHNLEKLMECLEARGVTISDNSKWIILGLSAQHASHDLRYTALLDNEKPTFMPPISKIYAALEELLLATRLNQQ